ncbi:MAG: phosphotransferase [Chloroflexi bacterium]|nr:phosphotransferase [Chloroflexota bacterium]
MPSKADPAPGPALVAYDLGELQAVHRVERGYVNEHWIIETDRGCYFCKRYHPGLGRPVTLCVQHILVGWLVRAGFPAPALVPARTGETLVVHDGECYEVQEYIPGGPYDHDRPAHLIAAAETLARYHALVVGFAPPDELCQGDLYSPTLLRANLDRLARAWAVARAADLAPAIGQLVAHTADLESRFAGHGPLPHVVIHGDYYAGNLLFDRDGDHDRDGDRDGDCIVGVVDWDKACWQPRVVELAEALIYFASSRPGLFQHLVYPGPLDRELFTRFLRAYADIIAPTDAELHVLPDVIRCIWLQISLQRLFERGPRPPEALAALQEVLTLANVRIDV